MRLPLVRRPLLAATCVAAMILVSACGGSGSGGSAAPSKGGSTTAAAGAADPNATEVVAPGDIPDDQVFVPYTPPGASYSIKVPEGWARAATNGTVKFTDNYNSIEVRSEPSSTAPTVASVTSSGLSDVSDDPTFTLGKVSAISRTSGPGVLATYTIGSAPNPVTGKKALLAVERYEFGHAGTTVVLTLSGAKGADNVDPWRIVSDSLTWI
jgi:hypothetical protein